MREDTNRLCETIARRKVGDKHICPPKLRDFRTRIQRLNTILMLWSTVLQSSLSIFTFLVYVEYNSLRVGLSWLELQLKS